MWSKLSGCAALLMVSWTSLNAQKTYEFSSLEALIQYADSASPAAAWAKAKTASAEKDAAIAYAGLLPKINAFGNAEYYPIIMSQVVPASIMGGSADEFRTVRFGLPMSLSTGAELSVPVLNLEKWSQVKKWTVQGEWNALQVLQFKKEMHQTIAQWYYAWLMFHDLENAAAQNLTSAELILKIAMARDTQGVIEPPDVKRLQMAVIDQKNQWLEYQKSAQTALIQLKRWLGLGEQDICTLGSDLENLLPSPPAMSSLQQSLSFKEWSLKSEIAKHQFLEIKNAAFPKIQLAAKYTYQFQWDPSNDTRVDFDYSNISLRLELPLYQGNHWRNTKNKYQMEYLAAQKQWEMGNAEFQSKQNDLWNQWNFSAEKYALLSQKIKMAEEYFGLTKAQFEQGIIEYEPLHQAFLELQKAQNEKFRILNDLRNYQYQLNNL